MDFHVTNEFGKDFRKVLAAFPCDLIGHNQLAEHSILIQWNEVLKLANFEGFRTASQDPLHF